jgi:hypothetical protein
MPQNGRRRSLGWPWLLAWLGALPLAVARAGTLPDSDTFWQIRTGNLILATHRLPATDPYSWSAYGRTWHANSWLFDVLVATTYRPGRLLVGVALLGVGLTLVAVAAQLLLAAHLGAHPVAAGLMVLVATPVTIAWFAVRPQLVDYIAVPLLVVLVDVALTAPPARALPTLAGIFALQTAWVNLHSTAPLGIVLAAAAGATSLRGHRRPWRAIAPAAAATLGTIVNPYGPGVITEGFRVHNASADLIKEWLPVDLTDPFQDLTILLGVVTIVVASRRRYWRLMAVLVVEVVGAVAVRRMQPLLAVTVIGVLAAALDTAGARAWMTSRRTMLRLGAAILTATYAVLALRAAPHLGRVSFPDRTVRALPAHCRLFNSYDLGGIVILLRPDVPVSLDSRNDLYGRRELLDRQRVLDSTTGGAARLADMGVDCVLVRPATGLGRQLSRDPAWRDAAHHPDGTAYLRRPTEP